MPEITVPSAQEEKLKELQSHVMKGYWPKVLETYEQERTLRMAKLTETGETVLHMAVSNAPESLVASMVELSIRENDATNVLAAENNKKSTPLHLAATRGNVETCKKIGNEEPYLITKRNNVGETPLFLAALYGRIEAFLWLHHIYAESQGDSSTDFTHCIRDNNDTILHCAIAEGHFDVAIEIVLLYEHHLTEMTNMRNKNGLSPLHFLAATPSAFKHANLLSQSYLVKRLYYWILRVQEKKQATTRHELERRERMPRWLRVGVHVQLQVVFYQICSALPLGYGGYGVWARVIGMGICLFLPFITCLLAALPFLIFSKPLVLAVNWFHGIQKKEEMRIWPFQIMNELLQHASTELMSEIKFEPLTAPSETKEGKEAGTIIVETPLMIAATNGVIELIEKILELFPSTAEVVNEEGKNVVLLVAEKRQTKVYQILCGSKNVDRSLFRHVDKDGNTALHLAAKLGLNLNWQATTMIEEFKWFQFVKSSMPSELWEKYNNDGKTAEEIFRDSYKEHMTSDRQWLNQTSQTCSVASTLVASMAFSNFAGENINKKNNTSLVALSLSLTSTISFLAILAFRSQSLNFWRYAPFILHIAILTMFGSIVALWISLTFHGKSLTTYAIIGSPIAILTIVSLPIFIGPALMSMFAKVPPPNRGTTNAIRYRRPQKKDDQTYFDRNQKPNQNHIGSPMTRARSF